MSGHRRSRVFLILAGLGLLESLFRLVFYYLGTYGGAELISPPPPVSVMQIINSVSLLLGVVGLAVFPGLIMFRRWGFWGTIALCVTTTGFDLWAFSTTAQTAAAGLLVPLALMAYLVPKRQTSCA